MGLLDNTTSGKVKTPLLALIYGRDGVGKTTFAAEAPKPFFIGKEAGSLNLEVTRYNPPTFLAAMEKLNDLERETHEFKTVAIDSLDWIEPMVWQAVCEAYRVDSIEKVGGGYGKGYLEAQTYWSLMMTKLQKLRHKGMNVIVIAHSHVKVFNDPLHATPYDRYQLKLNDKAAAMWREFVDFVLFANFEVFTKVNKSGDKAKALGEGRRMLYTEGRPSFDAKRRVHLPDEMPLGYRTFNTFLEEAHTPKSAATIRKSIDELAPMLAEDARLNMYQAIEASPDDVDKLNKILNHLRFLTGKEPK